MEEYSHALDEIMIKRGDGIKLVPELYAVPKDKASTRLLYIYFIIIISIKY